MIERDYCLLKSNVCVQDFILKTVGLCISIGAGFCDSCRN